MSLRKMILPGLMICLLGFAGCLVSKFTLAPLEQAKVDRAYVGNWDTSNTPGNDHADLIIRNIDDKMYYVELREKDKPDAERYVGFIADVKGVTFAHLRPMQADGDIPDEWVIQRIAIKDGKLSIRGLSEDFFKAKKIESAQQLRQVIEENLDNDAMYDKDSVTATRIAAK